MVPFTELELSTLLPKIFFDQLTVRIIIKVSYSSHRSRYRTTSYCIIVSNIDGVAKTKHGISEAFEVGLSISEVSGCLLQPLAEPFGILSGLSISVGSHKKHTD